MSQIYRKFALDWHRYGRIGEKNLRGRINGNTLCKLPWPEALGLYTPWLPLSFTSFSPARSTAKSAKNRIDKSTGLLSFGGKKRVLQSCLAWGQQLHLSSPIDLQTWPVAVSFYMLRGVSGSPLWFCICSNKNMIWFPKKLLQIFVYDFIVLICLVVFLCASFLPLHFRFFLLLLL